MTTGVLAIDKRVEQIAILCVSGTTCTVSAEKYNAIALAPERVEATLVSYSPLPSSTPWESQIFFSTLAMAAKDWNVIEPAALPGSGIEAAAYLFAKRVARIPDVVAVTYSMEREVYLLWTFIRQRDKAIRRQVYQQELQLMHEFPTLTFDFNVVAMDQTESRSLLPDDLQGRIILYRE